MIPVYFLQIDFQMTETLKFEIYAAIYSDNAVLGSRKAELCDIYEP